MNITKRRRAGISKVIKAHFPGKVHHVEMEPWIDYDGDELLLIQVYMDKSTTEKDLSGKMFDLNALVMDAMGEEMRGTYPFIRLKEARG